MSRYSITSPAELYRSRAVCCGELDHSEREKIGDGNLGKMVRLAIGDPDDELWRYFIKVAEEHIEGEEIRKIADQNAGHMSVGDAGRGWQALMSDD